MTDTIFALSSGSPPAAVAVLRISGPAAGTVARQIAGRLPAPRRAGLRTLRDTAGELLDQALVLWFPGPTSATGEDVVELHLHGGRATVAAVSSALDDAGLRLATPGEFTRRALLNGRIDLAQAEGLADLLMAQTADQRRMALAASEGHVTRALCDWHDRLVAAAALVEAQLDHADEDDVPDDDGTARRIAAAVREEMDIAVRRPTVERLHDGISVVLAGPPNAGKSSLFNALLKRDAAIVTPLAGTTRDVLEAAVVRNGRVYRLVDTAGLGESTDPVERIGVQRARLVQQHADILLWLGDEAPPVDTALWVNARCDLPGRSGRPDAAVSVSCLRPTTIDALWTIIDARSAMLLPTSAAYLLTQRQQDGVRAAAAALAELDHHDELVVAEALRRALVMLDAVLGRHAPEAVLDALFGRFCIGK